MSAVLFGSIGALADTSELQRESFNDAFTRHGLSWNWSRDEYRDLLRDSGGESRVAAYAKARGEDVDAAAVHRTKSEIYRDKLAAGTVTARPGVAETIESARADGRQIAFVTTTSAENVAALGKALAPEVDIDSFALVLDVSDVDAPKPAPDVYALAVQRLGETAAACVAVEDNAGGVRAAVAAGVPVIAFPGENNAGHDFSGATAEVTTLSPDDVSSASAAD